MNIKKNNEVETKALEIILDTNILQYLSNKELKQDLQQFLNDFIEKGYTLAISEISIFELLRNLSKSKEEVAVNQLNIFEKYQVTSTTLTVASQLSTIYSQNNISPQQISIPDLVIAATAVLTNTMILTSDINDFPRPFFSEILEMQIFYKKKSKTKLQVFQLLSPNLAVINAKFSERTL